MSNIMTSENTASQTCDGTSCSSLTEAEKTKRINEVSIVTNVTFDEAALHLHHFDYDVAVTIEEIFNKRSLHSNSSSSSFSSGYNDSNMVKRSLHNEEVFQVVKRSQKAAPAPSNNSAHHTRTEQEEHAGGVAPTVRNNDSINKKFVGVGVRGRFVNGRGGGGFRGGNRASSGYNYGNRGRASNYNKWSSAGQHFNGVKSVETSSTTLTQKKDEVVEVVVAATKEEEDDNEWLGDGMVFTNEHIDENIVSEMMNNCTLTQTAEEVAVNVEEEEVVAVGKGPPSPKRGNPNMPCVKEFQQEIFSFPSALFGSGLDKARKDRCDYVNGILADNACGVALWGLAPKSDVMESILKCAEKNNIRFGDYELFSSYSEVHSLKTLKDEEVCLKDVEEKKGDEVVVASNHEENNGALEQHVKVAVVTASSDKDIVIVEQQKSTAVTATVTAATTISSNHQYHPHIQGQQAANLYNSGNGGPHHPYIITTPSGGGVGDAAAAGGVMAQHPLYGNHQAHHHNHNSPPVVTLQNMTDYTNYMAQHQQQQQQQVAWNAYGQALPGLQVNYSAHPPSVLTGHLKTNASPVMQQQQLQQNNTASAFMSSALHESVSNLIQNNPHGLQELIHIINTIHQQQMSGNGPLTATTANNATSGVAVQAKADSTSDMEAAAKKDNTRSTSNASSDNQQSITSGGGGSGVPVSNNVNHGMFGGGGGGYFGPHQLNMNNVNVAAAAAHLYSQQQHPQQQQQQHGPTGYYTAPHHPFIPTQPSSFTNLGPIPSSASSSYNFGAVAGASNHNNNNNDFRGMRNNNN